MRTVVWFSRELQRGLEGGEWTYRTGVEIFWTRGPSPWQLHPQNPRSGSSSVIVSYHVFTVWWTSMLNLTPTCFWFVCFITCVSPAARHQDWRLSKSVKKEKERNPGIKSQSWFPAPNCFYQLLHHSVLSSCLRSFQFSKSIKEFTKEIKKAPCTHSHTHWAVNARMLWRQSSSHSAVHTHSHTVSVSARGCRGDSSAPSMMSLETLHYF